MIGAGKLVYWMKGDALLETIDPGAIASTAALSVLHAISAWYDGKKRLNLALRQGTLVVFCRWSRRRKTHVPLGGRPLAPFFFATGVEGTSLVLFGNKANDVRTLSLSRRSISVAPCAVRMSGHSLVKYDRAKQHLYFESLTYLTRWNFKLTPERLFEPEVGLDNRHVQMLCVWQKNLFLTEASDWMGLSASTTKGLQLSPLFGFPNHCHSAVEFPFDVPANTFVTSTRPYVPLAGGGVALFFDRICCFFDPPRSKCASFTLVDVIRLRDCIESIHENPVDGSTLLLTKRSVTLHSFRSNSLVKSASRTVSETLPNATAEELQQTLPPELVDRVFLFCMAKNHFR